MGRDGLESVRHSVVVNLDSIQVGRIFEAEEAEA